MKNLKVAVLGGGSFGTAIAHSISVAGNDVVWWMRNDDQVRQINEKHINLRYANDYVLSEKIIATSDLKLAVENSSIIFVCIPSKAFRLVSKQLSDYLNSNTILISCTKGMEPETFKLMSNVLEEETRSNLIGVLSGPNLAKEIMQGMPTGTVIASDNKKVIELTQKVLSSEKLRVYSNNDRYGVELGGTLKNIYAVATGLVSALGMGNNTLSLIITRGIAEISRYSLAMGADPMTFIGLGGIGDLIATCNSPLSRNYRVGYQIGEGKTLEEAVQSLGEVAEGVNTIYNVYQRVKKENLYMPMVPALYQILFENKPPLEAIKECMIMEQTLDVEFSAK